MKAEKKQTTSFLCRQMHIVCYDFIVQPKTCLHRKEETVIVQERNFKDHVQEPDVKKWVGPVNLKKEKKKKKGCH